MTVRELNLTKLEKEVRGLREFLITELLPRMEKIGERKPILLCGMSQSVETVGGDSRC